MQRSRIRLKTWGVGKCESPSKGKQDSLSPSIKAEEVGRPSLNLSEPILFSVAQWDPDSAVPVDSHDQRCETEDQNRRHETNRKKAL